MKSPFSSPAQISTLCHGPSHLATFSTEQRDTLRQLQTTRTGRQWVDSRVRREPVTFISELFIQSPESTVLSGICFFAPKFNPRELAHHDFQKSNCRRKETLEGEGSLHSLHQSPPPKRLLCMRGGSSLKLETE